MNYFHRYTVAQIRMTALMLVPMASVTLAQDSFPNSVKTLDSRDLAVPPSASSESWLGLYPAGNFILSIKGAPVAPASRQASWYFRNEIIGVPRPGLPVAGFGKKTPAFSDLRNWAAGRTDNAALDYPPLIWIAAPDQVQHARITERAREIITPQGKIPLQLVPKLELNRSYVDASTLGFFKSRDLSLRGTATAGVFVARTVWPEEFRLGPNAPAPRELPPGPPQEALRAMMREVPRGSAIPGYTANTLWQRPDTGSSWAGNPVIGLMVNGAQGDDDEAYGGHFAIVTGRVQPDGSIGNWLVNNFYSLDVESEKGILAAPVPLDNYMGDLNSGQSWYRPSTMLVVVLKTDQAAVLVQSALNRAFNQFYRHQLPYYHPNQNCASTSIDTLRSLGWDIPARGPSSRVLAWAAYPFVAIKDRSIAKGKLAFDYLHTDQTRLMPAASLEESFGSLLGMTRAKPSRRDGKLEKMLKRDMQAITFLTFPQFPSSRALGGPPAISTWEYRTLVPSDPAMAKIIPVPPRPFPPELRDPDLLPSPWTPGDYATLIWGIFISLGVLYLLWRWWKPTAND